MNEDNITALKESIERWKSFLTAKNPYDIFLRIENCALCRVNLLKTGTCKNCPVFEKTGYHSCRQSPYEEASLKLQNWRASPNNVAYRTEFYIAARNELLFLESLLREKEKVKKNDDTVNYETKLFRDLLTMLMDNSDFEMLSVLLKKINLEHEDPRFLIMVLRIVYYERTNIPDWNAIKNSYKDAVCSDPNISAAMMFDMAFTGIDC